MPLLWNKIKPATSLGLTNIMNMQNVQGLLYIPNIRWLDAAEVTILNQDFNITSTNRFTLKQVVVLKLVQPHFQFRNFPNDTQTIQLRVTLFGYPNTTASLQVYKQGIYYFTDYDGK